MTYIIFLLTIQIPFLYFAWKLFNRQSLKINRNLQVLRKQNEHIANFMDTLRMSIEKISDDVHSKTGPIQPRLEKIEKELEKIKSRTQKLEVYTGLNTENSLEEVAINSLKDKDFA